MRRAAVGALACVVLLGFVGFIGLGLVWIGRLVIDGSGLSMRACTIEVDGVTVSLDTEQARYASYITAVSVQRDLPARAATIALATVYQESRMRNIDYGDRDSLGLFQQRPSQGWGTEAEVMDPEHATARFYDALVQVEGYLEMEVTVAAQAVQRSGFPDAYARHERSSRALASAFTGHSVEAVDCTGGEAGQGTAQAVADDLDFAFGDLVEASPDVAQLTVQAIDERRAWAVAHYAVANAQRLGVSAVDVDGRRWSGDGWSEEGSATDGSIVIEVLPGD